MNAGPRRNQRAAPVEFVADRLHEYAHRGGGQREEGKADKTGQHQRPAALPFRRRGWFVDQVSLPWPAAGKLRACGRSASLHRRLRNAAQYCIWRPWHR